MSALPDTEELAKLLAEATPGPWFTGHLCDDQTTCDCKYIFCNHLMGAVASVYVDDGESDDPPREQAEANQRLISLAPALAAQRIADAARIAELEAALKPFADIGIGSDPDYQPMIRMDRDAIVKARAALTRP